MHYRDHINSAYAELTLDEVLRSGPSVLLGVTKPAEQVLSTLAIHTVFDLGMSTIFDHATQITDPDAEPRMVFRRFGRVPRSMVDADRITRREVAELPHEGIEALIGVGPNNGPRLEQHLGVSTIRDLAMWPPYLAARELIAQAYMPPDRANAGAREPAGLVPKSGEHGTERFSYSSIVMFPGDFGSKPLSLEGHLFDISLTPPAGFDRVRFGALMTYSQTWYPQRVAKGQLLHSLPLAPGESTRVAVIDWNSKTAAVTHEDLSEMEALTSVDERARTVTEIARTVATELQSGSSRSATESVTASLGGAGPLAYTAGFGNFGLGMSETAATTHTVSSGTRTIDTYLAQNIQDSTQQVASAVRGQRAAVISEVSQQQAERLSTRVVTNYNHMHALTIQYYEVVQINELQVRIEDCERCIFIPLELVDFTDERNIFEYREILEAVALDHRTKAMLVDVEGARSRTRLRFHRKRFPDLGRPDGFADLGRWADDLQAWGAMEATKQHLAHDYHVLAQRDFIRAGRDFDRIDLHVELQLTGLHWDPWIGSVVIVEEDGTQTTIEPSDPDSRHTQLEQPLSFGSIDRIWIELDSARADERPNMERIADFGLGVKLRGEPMRLDCSFHVASGQPVQVLELESPVGVAELGRRLQEERLHYSQQIWRRQDPQIMLMKLAPYTLKLGSETINLVDHISPVPVQYVGNFAVYRFSYERDGQWQQWLRDNVDRSKVWADQVAVPTGGVFAEAVLGRANAAEQLDPTRFFDWQESPPDPPPRIAALEAGTHAEPAGAPAVPTFDPLAVQALASQTLPDPSGLAAALGAIATEGLFRNMSGEAGTGTIGEAATATASATSIDALTNAGKAFAKTIETLATGISAAGGKGGLGSLSSIGALANALKDERISAGAKKIIEELLGQTAAGGLDGTDDDTDTDTEDDAPPPSSEEDFPPLPQLIGERPEGLDEPPLDLLTIYLSQYEGNSHIPPAADELFRWNIAQGLGQQLRHHHLAHRRERGKPVGTEWLFEQARDVVRRWSGEDDLLLTLLLCHNHTRSFGLREGDLAYESMALPWRKLPGATDESITYQYGQYTDDSRVIRQEHRFRMSRGSVADDHYLITIRDRDTGRLKKVRSGFYLLHDPEDPAGLGVDAPNNWYHFFLAQMVTAGFSTKRLRCHETDVGLWDLISSLTDDVLDSAAPKAAFEERVEPLMWTYVLHAAALWLSRLLRKANPSAKPDNEHYDGWVWMNAMSMMEGIFYGRECEQEDSARESAIHRKGALEGILRVVSLEGIGTDGEVPTWRWVVPKAMDLKATVAPIVAQLKEHVLGMEFMNAYRDLETLEDALGGLTESIAPFVHEVLDIHGNTVPPDDQYESDGSLVGLATAIYYSDKITLAEEHSRSVMDEATAKHNIRDTMQGHEAQRTGPQPNPPHGPGGSIMLGYDLLAGIILLSHHHTLHVSELAGGVHSDNSRHYAGVAVDISRVDGRRVAEMDASAVAELRALAQSLGATEILGPGDPDHANHFHLGWPRP